MYPTSKLWPQYIRGSHTVISRADLYPVAGPPIFGLPITAGNVTVDSTSNVRRTLDCEIADQTGQYTPSDVFAVAAPYGAIIRPWRGILYPDGTSELLPLGVFRISSLEVTDDGVPALKISGSDYSRTVARNKFIDPYVITAGQNYATAIATLADDRLPGLDQNLDSTAEVTPLIVIDAQEDPWQHLQDMAAGFGFEVFYDQDGGFVLQQSHDPTDDQVQLVYASGEDAAVLTAADDGSATSLPAAAVLLDTDETYSDEPGFNGVVMVAESTTLPTPFRTVLWDMDPTSATYSQGPYGQVPDFQSSPFITSQAACDAAAAAWLKKHLGGTDDVSFSIIPDPSLDAGDVIRIKRSASNLDTIGVITGLTIPLAVTDKETVTLRSRLALVSS